VELAGTRTWKGLGSTWAGLGSTWAGLVTDWSTERFIFGQNIQCPRRFFLQENPVWFAEILKIIAGKSSLITDFRGSTPSGLIMNWLDRLPNHEISKVMILSSKRPDGEIECYQAIQKELERIAYFTDFFNLLARMLDRTRNRV
jgi:hypothetical protein